VKVYKGSGNAEGNLRLSDKLITSKGWGGYESDRAKNEFERRVTGGYATYFNYSYPQLVKPDINLNFFPRNDVRFQDNWAKEARDYMSIQTDIPLGANEYLYGIRVVTNYRE
jgi:hypothetical protein